MGKQKEYHTVYTVARGLDLTLVRWSIPNIILEARVDGLYWRMLFRPFKMDESVVWEMEGEASISEYELLLHEQVVVHTEFDEFLWEEHKKGEIDQWMKTPSWKFENDKYRYYAQDNRRIDNTLFAYEVPEFEF